MQEIALVLGSVAGACTAIAIDRIPKRKNDKLIFRTNPVIKNQIQSLQIEKEILTKTISRLYQHEAAISKIQRDKLLLRYQHQLGLVITKIEKLEAASKHPDLGPLGDGLITLMDQKLSHLDQRLHELSSKITTSTVMPSQLKQPESLKEINQEKPQIKKTDTKNEVQKPDEIYNPMTPMEIPIGGSRKSVEIITLTEIPNKTPEFPTDLVKPAVAVASKQTREQTATIIEEERPTMKEIHPIIEVPKPEPALPAEQKAQIPVAIKIPENEKLEDDDKDIDKIKSEIMKALSKLEQVEVE
ncbi:MAG: hypothetical protein ACREAF_06770 [Nitrosopumilaceae archaeon]